MRNRFLNIFAALFVSLLLWLLIPSDFFNEFYLKKIEEKSIKPNEQIRYCNLDNSGIIKQLSLTKHELGNEIKTTSNNFLEILRHTQKGERFISQYIYAADLDSNNVKELYYLTSFKDSVYLNSIEYSKDRFDSIVAFKKALVPIKYYNNAPDVQNFGMQSTADGKIVFNLQSGFMAQPRGFYIYDVKDRTLIKTKRNSIVHTSFKIINYKHKNYILPTKVIASGNTINQSILEEMIKISNKDSLQSVIAYKPYTFKYGDFSSYILLYNSNLDFEFKPIEFFGWTNSVLSDYIITNDSLYILSITDSQKDSNFTRELIVTNIKGQMIKRIENISYSNIFCNSATQKIVLQGKDYLEIYDAHLNLLKKINTPSLEFVYGFKDIDNNGSIEFVLHTNNDLVIYNEDFSSKIETPISSCGTRAYRLFSTFKTNNHTYLQIQIGNKFTVFEYSENLFYKLKYPIAILLFALSYLFTWFVLKLNRERLETDKIRLEKIVNERTLKIKKQSEELITKNKRLKELDEFKANMSGMIVHDLKNPLNAIINMPSSETSENQISIMKQYGKQMLHIVLNILDVYKYENSKIKLNISNITLYKLIDESISEVLFLANQKNITIYKEIIKTILVKADEDIIKRVIVNMLTNAIKYTPNNGSIDIKTEACENNTSHTKLIKISIKDTGIGIAKDKLHLVFKKYGQIKAKKSGSIKSTGLGLTFCKMAVSAHGTDIGVESELNKGSTFWFCLPLLDENISTKDVNKETIDNQNKIILNKAEKEILKPYVLELKELMVYEVSGIKNVIKSIKSENSKSITLWKQEIINSAFSMNNDRYNELIKEADY